MVDMGKLSHTHSLNPMNAAFSFHVANSLFTECWMLNASSNQLKCHHFTLDSISNGSFECLSHHHHPHAMEWSGYNEQGAFLHAVVSYDNGKLLVRIPNNCSPIETTPAQTRNAFAPIRFALNNTLIIYCALIIRFPFGMYRIHVNTWADAPMPPSEARQTESILRINLYDLIAFCLYSKRRCTAT